MGVTYKLKQEVIDHIIEKKKEDPSLSCRKLAVILQDAFHIEVSKSSINAVIKELNLSNPVGRRAAVAPKNFFIPREKKEELLAQVASFLPEIKKDGGPQITETRPAADIFQAIPEIDAIQQEVLTSATEPVHLGPDLLAGLASENQLPVEFVLPPPIEEAFVWSAEVQPVFSGLGYFFVYVCMQDILRKPIIGEILSRFTDIATEDADILESAVILKGMGFNTDGDLRAQPYSDLWGMLDLNPSKTVDVLEKFFGKNIDFLPLAIALEAEIGVACVEASYIKCMADSGHSYVFSADLGSFLMGDEMVENIPLFKSVQWVVDVLISRNKALIFDMVNISEAVAKEVISFFSGSTADKIDRIEVWSEGAENTYNMCIKNHNKINFITRINSEWSDLKECVDSVVDQAEKYFDPIFNTSYLISEGYYKLTPDGTCLLRLFVVEKENSHEKAVLLTNIPIQKASKIQILKAYLNKKPLWVTRGLATDVTLKNSHIRGIKCVSPNSTCDNVLGAIFSIFKERTRQMFFPQAADEELDLLLKVPVKVIYDKQAVHVRLFPEKDSSVLEALRAGLTNANRCCATDHKGRKFCFTLNPTA